MVKSAIPEGFPGHRNLEKGIALCGQNAREHLEAAEVLYKSGKFGISAALSTLAMEEYAKKIILVALRLGYRKLDKALWKLLFIEHEGKIATAWATLATLVPNASSAAISPFIQRLPELSSLAHIAKLRGLYVDYYKDAWHTPQDPGMRELATLALKAAREMHDAIDPRLEGLLSGKG